MSNKRLPNIWGPGSLFAYSALEGPNTWSGSIAGTLLGDRIGVRFHTLCRRELFFDFSHVTDYDIEMVTTDMIRLGLTLRGGTQAALSLLFAGECAVAGETPLLAPPQLLCEGDSKTREQEGLVTHRTGVGCEREFSALMSRPSGAGIRFALSFSTASMEEAVSRAREALELDLAALAERRVAFLESLRIPEGTDAPRERLLLKCLGNIKAQVYSPEGIFSTLWTTPDRLPHRNLWLWDSVFHSIGLRHISRELAQDALSAVFAAQRGDGFIPIMADPSGPAGELTQPPLLAWGVSSLCEGPSAAETARGFYPALSAYLAWNEANRRGSAPGLFAWRVDRRNRFNRCGESGMDNSPRFDNAVEMDCVDFCCYMANEYRSMEKLAALLGLPEDARRFREAYEQAKNAINEKLWDEREGLYLDREIETSELRRVKTSATFLPLFAGVCTPERAERLAAHLQDPASFGTALPIPSVALNDPAYSPDMWRGPVWVNFNYMVCLGLREYGYEELARSIADRTLGEAARWYESDGCVYESYDPAGRVPPSKLLRKGRLVEPYDFRLRIQNVRDFGWTSCLLVALAMEFA